MEIVLPTWALSPDGKAGLDTSSRIGRTRSAVDCFRGRSRCTRYFNGSVIITHKRLNSNNEGSVVTKID